MSDMQRVQGTLGSMLTASTSWEASFRCVSWDATVEGGLHLVIKMSMWLLTAENVVWSGLVLGSFVASRSSMIGTNSDRQLFRLTLAVVIPMGGICSRVGRVATD
jgi:hypothetical protein